jgi:hypothetical protein
MKMETLDDTDRQNKFFLDVHELFLERDRHVLCGLGEDIIMYNIETPVSKIALPCHGMKRPNFYTGNALSGII